MAQSGRSPSRSGRLSGAKAGIAQGVQLCLVQSLRDISDQIGRVLDADRQPGGVENAYFLADVSRNAGMGHACGQAGKQLGAAQAHRQLEDLQRVQDEAAWPPTMSNENVEPRAGALSREQTAGWGVLFVVRR